MSMTNSKAAIFYTCLALFLIQCACQQLLQDLKSQKLLFKRNVYTRPSQALTLIRLDSSTESAKSFKLLDGTSQIKNADSPFYLIDHSSSTKRYYTAQAEWNDYNTMRGVRGQIVDRSTYYIRSQFLLNETHHIVSNNFQPTSSEFECKYLYISTLTPNRANTIKFGLGVHDINYKLVGSFQNWTMSPSQNLKIISVRNYEQTNFWVLETRVENPTQYDISYQVKCKSEYEHNCGNGYLEGLEKCDNGNKQGCTNCTIDKGFSCSGNPGGISLCSTKCGDGILSGTQKCDTKNASNTGCINCQIVAGYSCTSVPFQTSVCRIVCGDGVRANSQVCDNGNQEGCKNCVQDIRWVCTGAVGQKSVCNPICGDKYVAIGEECDNGNILGCLNCTVSKGFKCTSQIGQTSTCQAICGDGMRYGSQECDNFNKTGCINCRKVKGYDCTGNLGQVSTCVPKCGDYIKVPEEQCDNGKKLGCPNCKIAAGYKCTLSGTAPTSICTRI